MSQIGICWSPSCSTLWVFVLLIFVSLERYHVPSMTVKLHPPGQFPPSRYSWIIPAGYLLSAEQDVCKVFAHFSRAMQTHSPGVVNDTGNSQERCRPSQGCHNPCNTQRFLRKHQNQESSLKLKAKARSFCNFQLFFPNSCAEKCFAGLKIRKNLMFWHGEGECNLRVGRFLYSSKWCNNMEKWTVTREGRCFQL